MKFLVADDHELFLQGLKFILEKEYPKVDIVLTNSYTGIFQVLEQQKDFDLIITDLAMPGANWLEALEKIHTMCSEVPIIIISAVFEKEILQKTFDIGVSGYISKSFPNSLIISAINLVLAGGMYIPPELLRKSNREVAVSQVNELVDSLYITEKQSQTENKLLTPRQTDVLNCLYEGLSNKQIAYKLGLSEGTVKIHITLLMRALKVESRNRAVKEAIRLGLLPNKEEN